MIDLKKFNWSNEEFRINQSFNVITGYTYTINKTKIKKPINAVSGYSNKEGRYEGEIIFYSHINKI